MYPWGIPPLCPEWDPLQKEITMSKSIKSNVKTVTRNSVSIPMEAAATTLELASDISDLALNTVRGAIPTTKRLGSIAGMFLTGMFNSELDEQEAKKLYDETTLETVFARIEKASLKAGQEMVNMWNEAEDSKSIPEKHDNTPGGE
jgi:hypothetical protein